MLTPQPRVAGGNPVNRIPFVRHRTVNQIFRKYRACRHPVERTRWHAIWLLARADDPRTPAQVAPVGRPPDPPAVEKNVRRRVRRLREANPGKPVEVWAEDEARLGLKPVTRRVWWLKGCRPTSSGRTKYEWLYVYGFTRPATGDTFTVILPRVKVERMAEALAAFAAHADPDGKKVLVLIVDRAG